MGRSGRRKHHAPDLPARLAALPDLPSETLKAQWHDLFGRPPPTRLGRQLMVRGIGHRLQEQALGGLAPSTRRQLAKIAAGAASVGQSQANRPTIKAGTRLLREWHGAVHEVIVEEDGVRYAGKIWQSLSAVAREITGTRWSGPRFFGLTGKHNGND